MTEFITKTLDDQTFWRAIILFGRNVASYKFALARSLAEVAGNQSDLIRLDELAEPFARHICSHLKSAPVQTTSRSSRFLDACRKFNAGELSSDALRGITVKLGFENVIDAFHVVNRAEVPVRFFVDERTTSGGIRLTQSCRELLLGDEAQTLSREVDSRWRLVETAWGLNLSSRLISVTCEGPDHELFVDMGARRGSITSARGALNGYQKGHCFFCFAPISLSDPRRHPDVEHFFPHVLYRHIDGVNYDGVWNLTLSCRDCNRGESGKFAQLPTTRLLARLHTRNEFLIKSHHPLRQTLIAQTGDTSTARASYLQNQHDRAKAVLIHEWESTQRGPERF